MSEFRKEKMINLIKELVAKFIGEESNKSSWINVTNMDISKDFKRATIFISVFPESKERVALEFFNRKKTDLRNFIKKNLQTKTIPFFDVQIDAGEKNRQLIDRLLKE